jgi:hypothetical protein
VHRLKLVNTWLNESEFADFIRKAKRQNKTPYAVLKELVREFLYDKNALLTFPFLAVCYALTITTYVLLF